MQVTTTGETTLTLRLPGQVKYQLQRNVWTKVLKPDHVRGLLAPTPNGPVVRADKELAPYWVASASGKQEDVTVRYDWNTHKFRLQPDSWTCVDRVAFNKLVRRRDKVRAITMREVLDEAPASRILIIRDAGVGDLMFLTAAVRALLKVHPKADLTLATRSDNVQMMTDTGLFTKVVDFFQMFEEPTFSAAVDLCNWVEAHPQAGKLNRMDQFADGLGVDCAGDYQMVCNPHDPNCPELEGVEKPVAINLSGSCWQRGPSFAHASAIVQAIADAGYTPVGCHDKVLSWWPEGVGLNLNGASVEKVLSIIFNSEAVVAVDTGDLHVANAMGKPSVGLFGPVAARCRVAGQPKCVVIESRSPCRNCYSRVVRCNASTRAKCFDAIPVSEVLEALEQAWALR